MVELEGRGESCRRRFSSPARVWGTTLSGQSFYTGWVDITLCRPGCGSSSLCTGLGLGRPTHFLVEWRPWKETTELRI